MMQWLNFIKVDNLKLWKLRWLYCMFSFFLVKWMKISLVPHKISVSKILKTFSNIIFKTLRYFILAFLLQKLFRILTQNIGMSSLIHAFVHSSIYESIVLHVFISTKICCKGTICQILFVFSICIYQLFVWLSYIRKNAGETILNYG